MNQSSGALRTVDRIAPTTSSTAAAAAGLVVVAGRTVISPGRSTIDASLTTTTIRQHQHPVAAMISTQARHGDDVIGSRRRRRSDSADSRWFVRPIHLHSDDGTSSEAAAIFFAADRNMSTLSVRVENGVSSSSRSNPPTCNGATAAGRNSIDGLLKTYFPATIVASRLRESIAVDADLPASPRQQLQQQQQTTSLPETTSPPNESEMDSPSKRTADGVGRSTRKPRPASGAGGAGRNSRPSSTKSSSSSASNGSFDRMYLTDSQSGLPLTALMSSPYKTELARLRLDRLRLEEEHLLELKRQAELERIRGPEPKWYEMRSSGFHREVRRNNDLLRKRDSWQAMLDYRGELERASHEFNMSTSLSKSLTHSSASSAAVIGNVE